ncbi:MAG: hypothetical protein AAGA86_01895, partial [Bacteroidota bacterium]
MSAGFLISAVVMGQNTPPEFLNGNTSETPFIYEATGEGGPARQVFTVEVQDDTDSVESGTLEFSLTKDVGAQSLLGINGSIGLVRFRDAVVYDPNANNLLEIEVNVSDSEGAVSSARYFILVVPQNQAPEILNKEDNSHTWTFTEDRGDGAKDVYMLAVEDDSDN